MQKKVIALAVAALASSAAFAQTNVTIYGVADATFDSVKASIETMLKRQEAQALAAKEGAERLEALRKGEDKLNWGAVKTVSRLDSRTISPIAAQAVFRLETTKLPAYAGAELPGSGYALIKVGKVIPGDKMDDATPRA